MLASTFPEGGQCIEMNACILTCEVRSSGTNPLIVEQFPDGG